MVSTFLPCSRYIPAAAAAKSLQLFSTLCYHIDSCPTGSSVPGILQARTLEWVAISFSNAWKWKVKVKLLSHVRHPATPWTAAFQAPPSMGFSRQEYWSGVPLRVVNPSLTFRDDKTKPYEVMVCLRSYILPEWDSGTPFMSIISFCQHIIS